MAELQGVLLYKAVFSMEFLIYLMKLYVAGAILFLVMIPGGLLRGLFHDKIYFYMCKFIFSKNITSTDKLIILNYNILFYMILLLICKMLAGDGSYNVPLID